MELPVKAGDRILVTLVDVEVAERIGSAKLSLGSHGYAQIWDVEAGYSVPLHRFIMGCKTHDGKIVDHINRNKLDNRKANLRFVSAGQSSANVTAHGVSRYIGVSRNHYHWRARGKVDGKEYHLGTYNTPEEAAEVAHAWRVENLPGYVWEQP